MYSFRHVIWHYTVRVFFCQAEDGIRYLVRSRGLGDVYKRQVPNYMLSWNKNGVGLLRQLGCWLGSSHSFKECVTCLLYTSDAADERSSVDLGGRRIIKKQKRTILEGSLSIHEKITKSG